MSRRLRLEPKVLVLDATNTMLHMMLCGHGLLMPTSLMIGDLQRQPRQVGKKSLESSVVLLKYRV
jgi:hypothetical protein